MRSPNGVVAVIVTFCPDQEKVSALLCSITPQVDRIVIVDNTPELQRPLWLGQLANGDTINLISLGKNIGVAGAQNVGVQKAIELQGRFVLIFDHDSLPAANMVDVLIHAYQRLAQEGIRVGAVGPYVTDHKLEIELPFTQLDALRMRRHYCQHSDEVISTSHLISSGSLIPIERFFEVGLMQEDLFIDYVDIEWSLRLIKRDYQLFGVCAAHMEHDLGDEPLTFLGRKILSHSPLRHYYLVRNAINLYKNPDISMRWKLNDMWRVFIKVSFYSLFTKESFKHMRMMATGLVHGLANRLGPY